MSRWVQMALSGQWERHKAKTWRPASSTKVKDRHSMHLERRLQDWQGLLVGDKAERVVWADYRSPLPGTASLGRVTFFFPARSQYKILGLNLEKSTQGLPYLPKTQQMVTVLGKS